MQQLELVFGEAEQNWNSYVVAADLATINQSYQDWLLELSIYDADWESYLSGEAAERRQLEHPEDAHSLRFNPYWDCDYTDECQCDSCEATDYVELSKDL